MKGISGDTKVDYKIVENDEYDATTVCETIRKYGYDLVSIYFANEWSFFEDELVKYSDVDIMIYNSKPNEDSVHIVK